MPITGRSERSHRPLGSAAARAAGKGLALLALAAGPLAFAASAEEPAEPAAQDVRVIAFQCEGGLDVTVAFDTATWPPMATLVLPDSQMPLYPQIRASGSLYQNGDVALESHHGTNTLTYGGTERSCVEAPPGTAAAAAPPRAAAPSGVWQAPMQLTEGEGGMEAIASVTQDDVSLVLTCAPGFETVALALFGPDWFAERARQVGEEPGVNTMMGVDGEPLGMYQSSYAAMDDGVYIQGDADGHGLRPDGPEIAALMAGRVATLSVASAYGERFSLNGAANAICRAFHLCGLAQSDCAARDL
ncbi:MAG: MliC family protein [Rhodospirillaceae bacterium]|nr:MliC family protein [Rhodospirillaceae bacterium]